MAGPPHGGTSARPALVILLRVVPPGQAYARADADAPFLLVFAGAHDVLTLATSAIGLGCERKGRETWLRASRAQVAGLRDELARRNSELAVQLDRFLNPVPAWALRTRQLMLPGPHIMGILNLTADSFSGDGVGTSRDAAQRRAEELRAAGASMVDVGAESARADRPVMDEDEEASLVAEVIAALVREGHVVSADTYKPAVARAALQAGAEVVNDISGLTKGTGAAEAASAVGGGYVLNYSYTVPKQRPPRPPVYVDVVAETNDWFEARLAVLEGLGLARQAVAIDPGIAFGKSHDEDLQVLRRLSEFAVHGQPLLLAHSRKNFLGSIAGSLPAERDLQTHAATVLALAGGVHIFRVHDVGGTRLTLNTARAILDGQPGDYAPDETSWPWRAGASAAHMTAGGPDKAAPGGQRW